jgi:hypothetical protein
MPDGVLRSLRGRRHHLVQFQQTMRGFLDPGGLRGPALLVLKLNDRGIAWFAGATTSPKRRRRIGADAIIAQGYENVRPSRIIRRGIGFISLKYAILVLRADNRGEGGIVALWACYLHVSLGRVRGIVLF